MLCDEPQGSGQVRLHGRDPADPEARRGLGYLPERLSLPSHVRVRDLLVLHAQLAGLDGPECQRQVEATMSRTGVADRAQGGTGRTTIWSSACSTWWM